MLRPLDGSGLLAQYPIYGPPNPDQTQRLAIKGIWGYWARAMRWGLISKLLISLFSWHYQIHLTLFSYPRPPAWAILVKSTGTYWHSKKIRGKTQTSAPKNDYISNGIFAKGSRVGKNSISSSSISTSSLKGGFQARTFRQTANSHIIMYLV